MPAVTYLFLASSLEWSSPGSPESVRSQSCRSLCHMLEDRGSMRERPSDCGGGQTSRCPYRLPPLPAKPAARCSVMPMVRGWRLDVRSDSTVADWLARTRSNRTSRKPVEQGLAQARAWAWWLAGIWIIGNGFSGARTKRPGYAAGAGASAGLAMRSWARSRPTDCRLFARSLCVPQNNRLSRSTR